MHHIKANWKPKRGPVWAQVCVWTCKVNICERKVSREAMGSLSAGWRRGCVRVAANRSALRVNAARSTWPRSATTQRKRPTTAVRSSLPFMVRPRGAFAGTHRQFSTPRPSTVGTWEYARLFHEHEMNRRPRLLLASWRHQAWQLQVARPQIARCTRLQGCSRSLRECTHGRS